MDTFRIVKGVVMKIEFDDIIEFTNAARAVCEGEMSLLTDQIKHAENKFQSVSTALYAASLANDVLEEKIKSLEAEAKEPHPVDFRRVASSMKAMPVSCFDRTKLISSIKEFRKFTGTGLVESKGMVEAVFHVMSKDS